MRSPAIALVVIAATIGAGCSLDNSAESDDNPSATQAPAFVIGEQETGTLTVTVETAAGTSPITVADRLDHSSPGTRARSGRSSTARR